jgi:glucose/galactose transporter
MAKQVVSVQGKSLTGKATIFPIIIIGFLFFIFGFISWTNSILIPYFRIAIELNNFESYLVTFAFYISYFIFSVPASYLLSRVGYRKGIMIGFWFTALGSFIFIPAALSRVYIVFLLGLFVLGAGTALLQTAANPYITILGPRERALQRISIMGIMNKFAGIVAPLLFAAIILKVTDAELFKQLPSMDEAMKNAALDQLIRRVIVPYAYMGVILFILGVLIRYSPLPEVSNEGEEEEVKEAGSKRSIILRFPHLVLGALAIFFHIGAQVLSIDTIISYANSLHIGLLEAKVFPPYTMVAMIISYIVGIICIPKIISQLRALQICSILGLVLTLSILFIMNEVTIFGHTASISIWFVVLLGFPNALIWGGIWPLALKGLGRYTKLGSAFLIMGLTANAVMPLIYGYFADQFNPHDAYWVMFPCFLYLIYYAFYGYKVRRWSFKKVASAPMP